MSSTSGANLRALPTPLQSRPAKKPRSRPAKLPAGSKPLTLATLVRGAVGAGVGGCVPIWSYVLAHYEIDLSQPLYAQVRAYFVVGLLVFSARKVYLFGRSAFGEAALALGFTLGIEGTMIVARTPGLAVSALAVLVGVNAVSVARAHGRFA